MIVKLGNCGGVDERRELSVTTAPGSFDTLVEIYATLGYTKGVLCIRKTEVYEYQDVEFALVEVPGHSYFYEAEKMAHAGEDKTALAESIKSVCADLGLEIYSSDDYFVYVERLNKEANEVSDFSKEGTGYFNKRFGF